MPLFKDANGAEWRVQFDGLLLDDVLQATGIDLADLSAGGLARIDQHAPSLLRVLAVLCGDEIKERQLTPRDFSRVLRGEALASALEAVLAAAQDFFPKSTWSAMGSHLTKQQEFQQQWMEIRPLLARLNEPDIPPALQEAVVAALGDMMRTFDSPSSPASPSVGGPEDTPPTSAANSPESAASAPAA